MFWSNIVKKRVLKRPDFWIKFVFFEQMRLIRWGERLFRNCLGTWISIEEMDKDLQNPQGKIWFLICICHGVRIGLYNWNFWNQILLKLFPFTKKDNKSLISCLFSYFFVSYAMISQIFSLRKAWSFGSPCRFGYWERSQWAPFCTFSRKVMSVRISIGMSEIPDCIVPKISPDQRFSRSNCASLNPSVVSSIAFRRL